QDIVQILLGKGADPNLGSAGLLGKRLPLFAAIDTTDTNLVTMLLEAGAKPGNRNHEGKAALYYAISTVHLRKNNEKQGKIVEALLKFGADATVKDKNGKTLLHAAANCEATSSVAMLIAAGAEVNARDNLQQTPLHEAATVNNQSMISALIKHGADTTI